LALLEVLRGYNEEPGFHFPDLLDYSGFYDGRDGELHLSPVVALVAAAAGARVVLTGGKARNNNSMHRIVIQDVLNGLGIRTDRSLPEVGEDLRDLRIGFIDTHRVNRALNNPNLHRIREDLGLRTSINTMEVSLNPARAPFHIRGMSHPGSMQQVARIVAMSGIKGGLIVRGIGGSGEIPTYRVSKGFEVIEGEVRDFSVDPARLGFSPGDRSHIAASNVEEQVEKLLKILEGKGDGTTRDITLLNAALVLYISRRIGSVEKGIEMAREALESLKPLELLEAWRRV